MQRLIVFSFSSPVPIAANLFVGAIITPLHFSKPVLDQN
ncbi:hypothetical protein PALB_2060 [Pseudoalteromonas luteoviolacea B = ATCC 29581]|nr:hypothetical protein PALB_2060 [Pseudoalteromonas luteoviolacea B = ATCC 29581]